MMLLIDAGNTRLKWALADPAIDADDERAWLAEGTVEQSAFDELASRWGDLPPFDRVIVANVAGPEADRRIGLALDRWQAGRAQAVTVERFRPVAVQAGLRNAYQDPAQLGPDRWAAALGAWRRMGSTCLVVSAGTATTIEGVIAGSAQQGARYVGGLILPGLAMMRQALDAGTARLRQVPGRHVDWPCQTSDAIESGCIEAQLGAIERARRRLGPGVPVVLTGGAAMPLAGAIEAPCHLAPRLVLEGLHVAACSSR
jgi:type III pantothenate kinase